METKKILLKRFDTVVANEIVSGMVWRRLGYSELKYGSVPRNMDIFWAIYVLQSFFFIAAKIRTVTMFFLVLIIL